jgi:hypothetical protein
VDECVTYEVVLPLRVVPQPQPSLNPGGDCSACVIAGILGLRVEDVYEDLGRGAPRGLTYYCRRELLERAKSRGLIDRLVLAVPLWPNSMDGYLAFGHQGHLFCTEWFDYMRMALDAGYYGIASVQFEKTGAGTAMPPETNHAVLICGVRERRVPLSQGACRTDNEVLVSCSSKSSPDLEWVEVQEFLAQRGGYNVQLVRPVSKG